MAESVDATALGAVEVTRVGSTPSTRTTLSTPSGGGGMVDAPALTPELLECRFEPCPPDQILYNGDYIMKQYLPWVLIAALITADIWMCNVLLSFLMNTNSSVLVAMIPVILVFALIGNVFAFTKISKMLAKG